jgi:hypothetical protein
VRAPHLALQAPERRAVVLHRVPRLPLRRVALTPGWQIGHMAVFTWLHGCRQVVFSRWDKCQLTTAGEKCQLTMTGGEVSILPLRALVGHAVHLQLRVPLRVPVDEERRVGRHHRRVRAGTHSRGGSGQLHARRQE